MGERTDALMQAQATLAAHADDLAAYKAAYAAAQAAGDPPPPPPPTIADAVAVIGHTLGNVALGVGSTTADAVGVVGATAQALHDNVNAWFSNLRTRLGV